MLLLCVNSKSKPSRSSTVQLGISSTPPRYLFDILLSHNTSRVSLDIVTAIVKYFIDFCLIRFTQSSSVLQFSGDSNASSLDHTPYTTCPTTVDDVGCHSASVIPCNALSPGTTPLSPAAPLSILLCCHPLCSLLPSVSGAQRHVTRSPPSTGRSSLSFLPSYRASLRPSSCLVSRSPSRLLTSPHAGPLSSFAHPSHAIS